jgi:predicted dehydrogenase
VDLAARQALRFQVGAMKRHDPGIEFARSFLDESLGRIVSFDIWYCVSRYRPGFEASLFSPFVVDGPPDERDIRHKEDRSRYLLLTHGAHVFDSLRFLLGEVEELNARLETQDGVFSWHGLVHLADGGLGHFELTVPVNGDWAEGFEIRGERGTVSIRTFFPFFLRPSEVRAFDLQRQEWRTPLCDESDPYVRQIEAFAKAVREGGPTSPNAADGLAALRLIETVERAVASRTWERVAE